MLGKNEALINKSIDRILVNSELTLCTEWQKYAVIKDMSKIKIYLECSLVQNYDQNYPNKVKKLEGIAN